mgnify:CR=1 FL=1
MSMALGIVGILAFVGCVVWLIVLMARKKPKKPCLLTMLASIALFFIGIAMYSPPTAGPASDSDSSLADSQLSGNTNNSAYVEALEQAQEELTSEQSSESDGRIAKEAYDKIKTGMTYDEVKAIIGSDGQNIFESGDKGTDSYSISYMWIGESGGEATIGFTGKDKLTVLMKSQSGLK